MTSKPFTTRDFQEQIREWYAEKSKDYRSDRYHKHVAMKKRRSDVEEELHRFEHLRDTEFQKLDKEFAEQTLLSRKSFEEKRRRSAECSSAHPTQADISSADFTRLSLDSSSTVHFKPTSPIKLDQILKPLIQTQPITAQRSHPPLTATLSYPPGQTDVAVAPQFGYAAPVSASSSAIPQPATQPVTTIHTGVAKPLLTTKPTTASFEFKPAAPSTQAERPSVDFTFGPTATVPEANRKDVTPQPAPEEPFGQLEAVVASDKTDSELPASSRLAKWISYYDSEYARLKAAIASYEDDEPTKDFRLHLKRSVREKIDMSTKKKPTDKDVAKVWAFLNDLMSHKTVVGVDGMQTQISVGDTRTLDYVIWFFCEKYMTLAKLDADLLDTIQLALVMLTRTSPRVHAIFCAQVVGNVSLIRLNSQACFAKINELSTRPSEHSSMWLQNESVVFRLFCRVELAQKPVDVLGKAEAAKGPPLLYLFLKETLELPTPIPLCSAFVVGEILQTCGKSFKKHAEFGKDFARITEQASQLAKLSWERLDQEVQRNLNGQQAVQLYRSRNATLVTLLNESLSAESR